MPLRPGSQFALCFVVLAGVYAAGFVWATRTDADAAASRYVALRDGGRPRAALPYGERALSLGEAAGAPDGTLFALRADLAATAVRAEAFARAEDLYSATFKSPLFAEQPALDRALAEEHAARARVLDGDPDAAVRRYAGFLDRAGDALAADAQTGALETVYRDLTAAATPLFAEALPPTAEPPGDAEETPQIRQARLEAAEAYLEVGGFFAANGPPYGADAAAGLLARAYAYRVRDLGEGHKDTVAAALLLAPVYRQLGRLDAAEALYLSAIHAREAEIGANNPDLSLYLRLLAEVYEAQGRATEAEALNEHTRKLFRDAFGARRYAVNRSRDRTDDLARPVSPQFPLPADYRPADLVPAADYSVPLSKPEAVDEMKLRLAAEPGSDPRETSMPARLALLLSRCGSDTGETLTLRSGYRDWSTQQALHRLNAGRGTVTPAGASEHQTGLAADIDVNGRFMRQSDRAYQCFREHAFRYGFILSYPPGNAYLPTAASFEPWHWRYVGPQAAQLYREAGPQGRPQEFLGALACYEERAALGAFPTAGEADPCLKAAPRGG